MFMVPGRLRGAHSEEFRLDTLLSLSRCVRPRSRMAIGFITE